MHSYPKDYTFTYNGKVFETAGELFAQRSNAFAGAYNPQSSIEAEGTEDSKYFYVFLLKLLL